MQSGGLTRLLLCRAENAVLDRGPKKRGRPRKPTKALPNEETGDVPTTPAERENLAEGSKAVVPAEEDDSMPKGSSKKRGRPRKSEAQKLEEDLVESVLWESQRSSAVSKSKRGESKPDSPAKRNQKLAAALKPRFVPTELRSFSMSAKRIAEHRDTGLVSES